MRHCHDCRSSENDSLIQSKPRQIRSDPENRLPSQPPPWIAKTEKQVARASRRSTAKSRTYMPSVASPPPTWQSTVKLKSCVLRQLRADHLLSLHPKKGSPIYREDEEGQTKVRPATFQMDASKNPIGFCSGNSSVTGCPKVPTVLTHCPQAHGSRGAPAIAMWVPLYVLDIGHHARAGKYHTQVPQKAFNTMSSSRAHAPIHARGCLNQLAAQLVALGTYIS